MLLVRSAHAQYSALTNGTKQRLREIIFGDHARGFCCVRKFDLRSCRTKTLESDLLEITVVIVTRVNK